MLSVTNSTSVVGTGESAVAVRIETEFDIQDRLSNRIIAHINPSPIITVSDGLISNRSLLALPSHPIRSLGLYSKDYRVLESNNH